VSIGTVSLVRRSAHRLDADPARVTIRLFVPGQEGFDHQDSRTASVLERILALDDDEVQASFDDVVRRFSGRHRDLVGTFYRHASQLADRLDPRYVLSDTRRLLIGAVFSSEYAIEGAALCNPSMVAHPDQAGVAAGSLRFVMSNRAIGEGHRSSIGFRTGVIDAEGEISIDETSPFATAGSSEPALFDAAVFRGELRRLGRDGENADYVLDALREQFSAAELEDQIGRLQAQPATRRHGGRTVSVMRRIAERTYGVRFADNTALSERVLCPAMGAESQGMEDARFVRFTEDGGADETYYATYTAYNGVEITEQLLETRDFVTFTSSPIVGRAATNKGLALFPRRIGGRLAALSRSDRETNSIAFSDNPRQWEGSVVCQVPTRAWEVLQLGNCGSPIETEAGWLVLTHGVGPMRTYSIGAVLLDLDDPTRVVGQLRDPLLTPTPEEQDGYVPNVVYSCGAMAHGDVLVLPYGISDSAIGIATVQLPELLTALQATAP
jgi:predicted GH43/DUF377 family glycosyl hydrolase